jgi:hypothetical protein
LLPNDIPALAGEDAIPDARAGIGEDKNQTGQSGAFLTQNSFTALSFAV